MKIKPSINIQLWLNPIDWFTKIKVLYNTYDDKFISVSIKLLMITFTFSKTEL